MKKSLNYKYNIITIPVCNILILIFLILMFWGMDLKVVNLIMDLVN